MASPSVTARKDLCRHACHRPAMRHLPGTHQIWQHALEAAAAQSSARPARSCRRSAASAWLCHGQFPPRVLSRGPLTCSMGRHACHHPALSPQRWVFLVPVDTIASISILQHIKVGLCPIERGLPLQIGHPHCHCIPRGHINCIKGAATSRRPHQQLCIHVRGYNTPCPGDTPTSSYMHGCSTHTHH